MKKTKNPTKLPPATVVGVPFYEEHEKVLAAASAHRMKKGPWIREVVRLHLGLPSQLDPAK